MGIWASVSQWVMRGLTATDDRLYGALGGAHSSAGEVVNSASVLGLSTAWSCVSLLSGTISSLSLDVYQKADAVKQPAPAHPLQSVLDSPNEDQTPIDFWEYMSMSLELWGNAYARVDRRTDGSVIALTPIRPDAIGVRRETDGSIRYRWYELGEQYDEDERGVFHVRGFGGDPLGGLSPIAWHRNTFGNAQAVERSAGATFRNGIRTSGILSTDPSVSLTKAQRDELDTHLSERFQGSLNTGRPMILDRGMKWAPITFNPEEAQMLESRGFSVEEICRIFGVPPFMVGHTEKVTSFGSGLEQQILGFQKFTLRKRLKKIEQAIRKQLMTPADRAKGFSVSFNLDDLLRGDSKARAEFYKTMLETKVYVINEVRAMEGKSPVAWGNEPWVQMQDTQIGHNGGPPLEDEQ